MSVAVASSAAVGPAAANDAVFTQPTYSSPIALSADNRLLWSVNPGDDSVSVLRTDRDTVIRKIRVGDEPQSVALDPNNQYAYVANAAGSSVTVVGIANQKHGGLAARVVKTIKTGAEPWNIVISPDGRRVFVANSGQDTITVINARTQRVIGQVDLRNSLCNEPDRKRHFQPRGLAVSLDNRYLLVTRFLSFTKPGGTGVDDDGEEGLVCRLAINTNAQNVSGYRPAGAIRLAARETGFAIDTPGDGVPGDGVPDPSTAFPNQLQSVVIRGDRAYLPNIAASPESPLQFQNSTEAFVNVIDGLGAGGSDGGALNLHLGARDPEPGKKRLFFANQWGIAFTTQAGAGNAYTISAGSDLLVKLNVDAAGTLSFTGGDLDTTRYIDLNDPDDPATSGANAGKNPQGIVITGDGAFAYTANHVSGNISKIDLAQDRVVKVIQTTDPPSPGSFEEVLAVGAEMFFSGRGHFDRPAHATISTDERLSSEGWQNCASCHFEGWTDGVVWSFGPGPRKSISLAATFNPRNREEQRILNYSAQRDETQDFTLNARNVSGPGALPAPIPCSAPPPDTSTFNPDQGLLVGDAHFNLPPCVINDFVKPNAGRPQVTVTLPGSGTAVPALDAMNEWLKFAVRVPNGPLTDEEIRGGVSSDAIAQGRRLFKEQQCTNCHSGGLWSVSVLDFEPPPALDKIFCERNVLNPALPSCATDPVIGNPNAGQYLDEFLRDVGSYNRGVAGAGNELGDNVGAVEKSAAAVVAGVAQAQQDALGIDFNDDGAGVGFGVSSLLGIHAVPPFGHNGSCETVACVVGDVKHRTANGRLPDRLANPAQQAKVVKFVESIDAHSRPFR